MSDSELFRADEEIRKLRYILWFRHGCINPMIYGDDGEMQCNSITRHFPIDFKRDTPETIAERLGINL